VLPLTLKRVLSKDEDEHLRGVGKDKRGNEKLPLHPDHTEYDLLLGSADGEVEVLKEDGSLLFHLIPGVFERADMERGFRHLKKVHGDCTTRPETTGTKNVLQRYADGLDTNMLRAPKEVTAAYRKKGCRANILGFMGPGGLHKYCRQTAWTAEDPEVLKNVLPLIRGANRVFEEYASTQYHAQEDHILQRDSAEDFAISNTVFTTVTVNLKLSTTYHRDEGDFEKGMGVMFTLGDFKGGWLVFPAFRVAIDYQPGSVILADVHETHGNMPNIEGDRITCVLYARHNINECGTAEEVMERMAGTMSVHVREE
jgi:hypothetical protein